MIIKILKIEQSGQKDFCNIFYKTKGGRKVKTGTIHKTNIDSQWNLTGLAQKIYGVNITYKIGTRVYSR